MCGGKLNGAYRIISLRSLILNFTVWEGTSVFFFQSDFDCALILSSWSKESIELIFLFYRSPRLTEFELL